MGSHSSMVGTQIGLDATLMVAGMPIMSDTRSSSDRSMSVNRSFVCFLGMFVMLSSVLLVAVASVFISLSVLEFASHD